MFRTFSLLHNPKHLLHSNHSLFNSMTCMNASTPHSQLICLLHRLWHQLTLKLLEFVAVPEAQSFLIALYEKFIASFETKLNSLSLVQLMIVVARQFPGKRVLPCVELICENRYDVTTQFLRVWIADDGGCRCEYGHCISRRRG